MTWTQVGDSGWVTGRLAYIDDDLSCLDSVKPQLGRGIDWEAVFERLKRPGETPEQEAERMVEIGKRLWEMSGGDE